MKPQNLLSVFQGALALEEQIPPVDKKLKTLKPHEVRNLNSFCDRMKEEKCAVSHFDGFFVGYSIAQIGKEFDLLRFGDDYILNIEIKSEIKTANKTQKILKQMRENYYYLKFLGFPLQIFTYVENDGIYHYNETFDNIERKSYVDVAMYLKMQRIDYCLDPDKIFVPSNYLISPFNSTDKFVRGEYFLTSAQQKVKDEIYSELEAAPFMFFCISANAGTGKTLLTYDIAKEQISQGKKVLLIHCGKLNDGHRRLIDQEGWDIRPIRSIPQNSDFVVLDDFNYIFIDESQRIRTLQLEALMIKIIEKKIPTIFSFDAKQYLREGETRDLGEYLTNKYPSIITSVKKLTTKIRTNKAMASFITNLMEIGKSQDNLNYDCVTIEYFNNYSDLKEYVDFLKLKNWMPITYTTSQHNPDPYDDLTDISDKNAHDVIGQEFSKVVFVMDDNFRYSGNKLTARGSYYSAKGMLYQIVTRVVDDLKIIVYNNPDLYLKLLEIKAMSK